MTKLFGWCLDGFHETLDPKPGVPICPGKSHDGELKCTCTCHLLGEI